VRAIKANASALALTGIALGGTVDKRWLALTASFPPPAAARSGASASGVRFALPSCRAFGAPRLVRTIERGFGAGAHLVERGFARVVAFLAPCCASSAPRLLRPARAMDLPLVAECDPHLIERRLVRTFAPSAA